MTSENGSGPTSSGPTFSIYCTLCSNLKDRISIDFIILMLLGLILDLPQSHFLAIRCSDWYIVMQIGELSDRTLKKLYIKKKNPIA